MLKPLVSEGSEGTLFVATTLLKASREPVCILHYHKFSGEKSQLIRLFTLKSSNVPLLIRIPGYLHHCTIYPKSTKEAG